jgi:hypothetical protein
MKAGRLFALVVGLVCLTLGVASLLPSLVQPAVSMSEPGSVTLGNYGYLFGLLPVNTAESIFYLTFGLFGVAAAAALDSSRLYAGLFAVVFGSLTLLGLIPVANTVFGLFPIYGNDVVLHGALALVAIYFGFFATPNLLQLLQEEAPKEA